MLEVAVEDGRGAPRGVRAEGRAVRQVCEIPRPLELYREEEGRADVYPLDVAAGRVSAAGGYLARPEVEARRVGLAVEEVQVVLSHEEPGVVNRVLGLGNAVLVG